MVRLKRMRKLNNSGSSLVTAIVVVSFICILATMMLYISGSNFVSKMTDRSNKEVFYEAETAMEQVKRGLILLSAEASNEAYIDTMVQYTVDNAFTRYAEYQGAFIKEFENLWNAKVDATAGADYDEQVLNYLKSFVDSQYAPFLTVTVLKNPSGAYYTDSVTGHKVTLDRADISLGKLYLRDVEIAYTKGNYTAVINTDFMITPPEMNWSVNASYKLAADSPDPEGEHHGTEVADTRKSYDIAENINYINWSKN